MGILINLETINVYMNIRWKEKIKNLFNKIFLNIKNVCKLIKLNLEDDIESLKVY